MIGCKTIANDLKDKTIDQVIEDYEVPPERQFTPEERKLIEEVRCESFNVRN